MSSNHQFPKAVILLITSCLLIYPLTDTVFLLHRCNTSGVRKDSISNFKHLPDASFEEHKILKGASSCGDTAADLYSLFHVHVLLLHGAKQALGGLWHGICPKLAFPRYLTAFISCFLLGSSSRPFPLQQPLSHGLSTIYPLTLITKGKQLCRVSPCSANSSSQFCLGSCAV